MSDSIKGSLNKMIDKRAAKYDRHAFYPCRVVAQNADGTLELKPDNPKVPSYSKVPIRYGMPGVAVQMSGGRVLLGFEGGDPAAPVAALFENSGITTVFLGGSNATGSDVPNFVALSNLVSDALTTLKSAISGATTTPNDGGASFKAAILASLSTWPPSVAATKVKAL